MTLPSQTTFGIAPARWSAAWEVRLAHHPSTIRFDRPLKTLPVSLTGTACGLQCAHCRGHYLKHMRPVEEAEPNGATSCLISGGCDPRGRMPLTSHLEAVARLRAGRRLNWHVGLVDDEAVLRQIQPHVDVISFDIVGDAATAREVYGLDLTLEDCLCTLQRLEQYARVMPHLTVGLRAGRLSGERAALHALAGRHTEELIFLILIPTPGTPYAACAPPPLAQVAELFLEARLILPATRLYLGCMRPAGVYRQQVDELAVCAGFNGVVNPTRAAERAAEARALEIVWGDECCALC